MVPEPHPITRSAQGDEELAARFAAITQWRRGGERAPHKPLLILDALARLQRGEPRMVSFAEIEDGVRRLLVDFGPPRKSFHPEYPFWHLQSDGLWEIPEREALLADLALRNRKNNPPRSVLLREAARGGFPAEFYERLRRNPALVNGIAQQLLDDNWPPSAHQDILDAIGMPWVQVGRRSTRDPAFRDTILRIYSHRCAVCGWDGRLGVTDLALEAAHVRWHAAGGPDTEDNGIALCSFHHKALDRGALGFDDDRTMLISQHLHGSQGVEEWLLRFAGVELGAPQPGMPSPAIKHLAWHRREVFRGPPRVRGMRASADCAFHAHVGPGPRPPEEAQHL